MFHSARGCVWLKREGLQGGQHQMSVCMTLSLPCWPLLAHDLLGYRLPAFQAGKDVHCSRLLGQTSTLSFHRTFLQPCNDMQYPECSQTLPMSQTNERVVPDYVPCKQRCAPGWMLMVQGRCERIGRAAYQGLKPSISISKALAEESADSAKNDI